MGYLFVVCNSRLGSVKLVGPKTNKTWHISRFGDWIDEEDEELLEVEVDSWCFRQNKMIRVRAVYETTPSEDQMRRMPI